MNPSVAFIDACAPTCLKKAASPGSVRSASVAVQIRFKFLVSVVI
jgi:hypothetical protein